MNVSKIRVIVESKEGVSELYDVVPEDIAWEIRGRLMTWRHSSDYSYKAKEIIDYLREAEKLTKEV